MGHHSYHSKHKQNQKIKKGLWSPEEDDKLFNYIIGFGVSSWSSVPHLAGLRRCGKSCRLRWVNYLRPDLKRGGFSKQEEDIILGLHQVLGNRWAQIARQLPGRTDNEVKNFWHTCLKKKLIKQGIDPNTHKPIIINDDVKEKKTSFAFEEPNIVPSSSSSSSMAELEQAFHLHNNGGLDNFTTDRLFLGVFETGFDPIGFDFNLLAQYQQMNYETPSTSFDFYDNSMTQMIMDSFVKNEEMERSDMNNNGDFSLFQFNGTTKCEEGNASEQQGLHKLQANNARDFNISPMGLPYENFLEEYFDVI